MDAGAVARSRPHRPPKVAAAPAEMPQLDTMPEKQSPKRRHSCTKPRPRCPERSRKRRPSRDIPRSLYISRTDARYARSLTSFTRPIWAFSFFSFSYLGGVLTHPFICLFVLGDFLLIDPVRSRAPYSSHLIPRTLFICLRISLQFHFLAVLRTLRIICPCSKMSKTGNRPAPSPHSSPYIITC